MESGTREYWASELAQSQETYRFFLQLRVALTTFAYTALVAVLSLWGTQLESISALHPEWSWLLALALSGSLAMLAVIFLIAESVGLNWHYAIGNHQRRWRLAAIRVGGYDAWKETEAELTASERLSGRMNYSGFALRALSVIGLTATTGMALAVPVLVYYATSKWADLIVAAVFPAMAFGLIILVYAQRSNAVRHRLKQWRWLVRILDSDIRWAVFAISYVALFALGWAALVLVPMLAA